MESNHPIRHPYSVFEHSPDRPSRMWSDPAPTLQRAEPAHLRPFAPISYRRDQNNNLSADRLSAGYNHHSSSRAMGATTAAISREIPLRPLPSTLMAHYRSNQPPARMDNQPDFESIELQSTPRVMRQAPMLLTLDDYNLISLGYKPVMSRSLSWISQAGIALTAANVFSGIIPLYGFALTNGGPAWATWSFLVIGIMSIGVSLCLSELASAYPSTAGVHHWVYQLGSSKRRAYLSWMVGWLTIASSVATTACVGFYFSSILAQILLSIHRVALTPAMLVMFHLGALFFWQIFNLFPIRGIGFLANISAIFTVGIAVALISLMLSLAGVNASLVHVPFTVFLNYSGDSNAAYAALSSTLMAAFVFCPQDAVNRVAEESRQPERTMPWLMTGSTVFSLVLGFPIITALNYGITKPIKGLLDETVPAVKVILENMGDATASVFLSLVLVSIFFSGFTRLALTTRTVYAFARDGGVPHSSYWNHLHLRRKTPQRVSWLVTAACMCCIFPFFWGNESAFQWIASLACILVNISFVVPLWMRLTREGRLHYIPGAFSLGRLSRPLHVVAIAYLIGLSLLLMLPSSGPLTRSNFNYAPLVLSILLIMFAISWFKARKDFTGGAKDVSRASHRLPTRSSAGATTPRKQRALHDSLDEDEPHPPWHAHPNPRFKPQPKSARTPPKEDPLQLSVRKAPRDQRAQPSNMTSVTMTSIQSHPSSILGIPFSDSPEMMPRELAVRNPTPPSPPPKKNAPTGDVVETNVPQQGLLLTRPFGVAEAMVPEISIAPPTTISTLESGSEGSRVKKTVSTSPLGPIRGSAGSSGHKMTAPTISFPPSSEAPVRPLNAIDSIFRLGLGLGSKTLATVQSRYQGSKPRSSKDRAPTPYPQSIADGEESAMDDNAMDEPHPFPALRNLGEDKPLPREGSFASTIKASRQAKEIPTVEEIVRSTELAVRQDPMAQYPTLDGYPLVSSPSLMDLSKNLSPPMMLSLSRTPTLQEGEEYPSKSFKPTSGKKFSIPGFEPEDYMDEDGELDLAEADDFYEEEYNHQYPVISISSARLQSTRPLTPLTAYQSSQGLFRLPNRDISDRPSPAKEERSVRAKEGRQDPIERLLQEGGKHPEQLTLQRTRTVANWANEQAKIQEKRAQRRARAEALKELRKGGDRDKGGKTLSTFSDLSSGSTSSESSMWPHSESWSTSSESWGKDEGRLRSKSLVGRKGEQGRPIPLEAVHEEESIRFSDIVEAVEAEAEEEEPGLYGSDEMSGGIAVVEVESLGAGVGRP